MKKTIVLLLTFLALSAAKSAELQDVVLPPNLAILGLQPGMPTEKAVGKILSLKHTNAIIGTEWKRTDNIREIADHLKKGGLIHEGGGCEIGFPLIEINLEFVGKQTVKDMWITGNTDGTLKSITILWTQAIPDEEIKALAAKLNAQFGEPVYQRGSRSPDWYDCKTQIGFKINTESISLIRCSPEEAADRYHYISSSIPNHTAQNILDLKMDGIGIGTPLKEILQSPTIQASEVWKGFGCTSIPEGRFTKDELLENYRILALPSSWEHRDVTFLGDKVQDNTSGMFGYPLYAPRFQLGLDPSIGDWRAYQIEYKFAYPESNIESIRKSLEEIFIPLLGEITSVYKDKQHQTLTWGGLDGPQATLNIYPTITTIGISNPKFGRYLEGLNKPKPTPPPDFKPRN